MEVANFLIDYSKIFGGLIGSAILAIIGVFWFIFYRIDSMAKGFGNCKKNEDEKLNQIYIEITKIKESLAYIGGLLEKKYNKKG